MKMIKGVTNPAVMRNIDVYLDGNLLDREHYGVITADETTGIVEYVMWERGPDNRRRPVVESSPEINFKSPSTDEDLKLRFEHWKLFKVKGVVEFDPCPRVPDRDELGA